MPSFRNRRRVAHSSQAMFDLVADVERYPDFLPFCESLVVRRRETDADGNEVVLADMAVGYKAIREKFTSRVTLDRSAHRILVEYIDGPFSHLENRWTFEQGDTDATSTIDFFIDYAFRSRVLALVAGAVFDRIFRSFVAAFESRADKLATRARVGERVRT